MVALIIVTSLTSVGLVGYSSLREKARMTTGVNAARNLMTAYLGHAADHSGRLLPGYKTDESAVYLDGKTLHHPINARCPWRLIPEMPQVEGVLLFNGNEEALNDNNSDYRVSALPNLGINAF